MSQPIELLDDHDPLNPRRWSITVSDGLGDVLALAHRFGAKREEGHPTLSFSSMLTALTVGDDPLCGWLKQHLSLRGASIDDIVGSGQADEKLPVPARTTESFRQALAEAESLQEESGQAELYVRHFMAAFATVPAYHLERFFQLRIDRREWCLELADHLAREYLQEAEAWKKYAKRARPVLALGLDADAPDGRDLLGVGREVESFAMLIASRATLTPLSIGVFGAWGSGKSFFLRRVRERVVKYAEHGRDNGLGSPYRWPIAQIEFNAWHYSEGNLVASLVDHVLRNLRFGLDEDEAELHARGAKVIARIQGAEGELADRDGAVENARGRLAAAEEELATIEAKLPAELGRKRKELDVARSALDARRRAQETARAQVQRDAEAAAATAPFKALFTVLGADRSTEELRAAGEDIRGLVQDASDIRKRWWPILIGLGIAALGAMGAFVMSRVAATAEWAKLVAAFSALGGFVTVARAWLGKLRQLADKGKRFQDVKERLAGQARAAVTTAREAELEKLRTATEAQEKTVADVEAEITGLLSAPGVAGQSVADLSAEREQALARRDEAASVLAATRAELERVTSGALLTEFLDELTSAEGYRKELTIFTRVRNQFERLSRLMERATKEYEDGGKAAPPLSRIVLYIDDLDRCPEEKVVEVLRVVHLLLAFPLFVCVVAVDPRWVTRALHEDAPGLVPDAQSPRDRALAQRQSEVLGEQATATDFLEKIFQIPLWLRPVPKAQRPGLVHALLGSGSRREPLDVPIADMKMRKDERAAGVDETRGDAIHRDDEREFLATVAPLLEGNPRSLKRFVNTYRLVKTSLSDVDFQRFYEVVTPPGGGAYRPYRFCMAQLAVLCTQRSRALTLVEHADRKGVTLLSDWLADMREDPELGETLAKVLEHDIGGLDVETFALWLDRTRRYSFYV